MYHARTKHPQISLEEFEEEYREKHDGQNFELEATEAAVDAKAIDTVLIKQFSDTLNDKDKKILKYRMDGLTYEEITNILGYKGHSSVIKRIKKIGQAYEEFTGINLGFDEE